MSSTVSTDVLTTLQLSPISANCSEVFQRCPISVIYFSLQKGLLSTYIVLLCFQIQKFALRFSTSCETEIFINALKVNQQTVPLFTVVELVMLMPMVIVGRLP